MPTICIDEVDSSTRQTILSLQKIEYSAIPTDKGICTLALWEGRVCFLALGSSAAQPRIDEALKRTFARHGEMKRSTVVKRVGEQVFAAQNNNAHPLRVRLFGTEFQRMVWRALAQIPSGTTLSYQAVAQKLRRPTATRAVASAIALNPVALLIPCHRVIAKDGSIRGYRWGLDLKRELLRCEQMCLGRG
ncbi:MAG: methylated-DNA--[protein]-cysteine S-methyltransferase [Deltaproteobacteria bacterium]|nr:methylated-DNA--[protein]-cysteine S-methyltransferase [Deltaproteobacteria bacterium]MBN2674307.1 methylated-DNA--[protein]-cysteine S-methyltransferase [Deltaproteobacteria bacterium]